MTEKRDLCEEDVVVVVEDPEDVAVDEAWVVDTMKEAMNEHIVDSQGDLHVALKTKKIMLMGNKSRKVGKMPDLQDDDVPEIVTKNADHPKKERLMKQAKLLTRLKPNQRLSTEKRRPRLKCN